MIWHNSSKEEVLRELSVDPASGLNSADVDYRLKIAGKNELSNSKEKSFFTYFVSEITANYSIALIVVAILHFILSLSLDISHPIVSVVIIIASLLSTVITAILKKYSDKVLGKLHSGITSYTTVLRNGTECDIPSTQLVPGDIMILKTGDYIRADARVLDAYVLKCDEFRITGETVPTDKYGDTVFDDITPIEKRENMIYSGSVVVNGKGVAVVTEIGDDTEIAKQSNITSELNKDESPLKSKLNGFQKVFSITALIITLIIFVIGLIVDFSAPVSFAATVIQSLLLSLSILVAVAISFIPFLLNASLLFSIKRLKKCGIAITDPIIAENLRNIQVICTDKTGALTTEKLTVVKTFDGAKTVDITERNPDEASAAILRLALICTNFSTNEHAERHSNNMEYAIESACMENLGLSKIDIDGMYPKVAELPFDSERMLMTTVTVINGSPVAIIKGAPEVVLSRCENLNDDLAEKTASEFAAGGLKVIAVAIKNLDDIPANPNSDELENGLTFAGIIGFEDSIDPVAVSQCKKCLDNGIKIVMITGDHIDTAVSIAKKAGIITDKSEAISGEELSKIELEELAEKIEQYSVFARISPEDKLKIVKALKSKYANVLVTGDSINDTSALLEADIGCALGLTASDMAKDASDIIVEDNRFYSIVHALKESKRTYLDLKKALGHLITFGITISIVVIFGLMIFGKSPLSATAVLLLGLFAYLLPSLGFFAEKYGGGIPFSADMEHTFDKKFLLSAFIPSVCLAIISLVSAAIFGASSGIAFAVLMTGLLCSAVCRAHSRMIISKYILKSRTMPIIALIGLFIALIITLSPIAKVLLVGNIGPSCLLTVLITLVLSVLIFEAVKLINKIID